MAGGVALAIGASLDHLETTLSQVERILEHRPFALQALEKAADASIAFGSWRAQAASSGWDVSRAFIVLGYMLSAIAIPTDTASVSHFTDDPAWIRPRLAFVRRAQVLAQGEGFGRPPLHEAHAWKQKLSQQWPLTNALPRRLLRSLGCPVANSSLHQLLVGPRLHVTTCRRDAAVFNVERWRNSRRKGHTQAKDLFQALKPLLELRALEPGRAMDYNLMELVLEEHVPDARGLFLEFGVFKGASLNLIARRLRALGGGRVYGFDSFQGLPETFVGGAGWPDGPGVDHGLSRGHFSLPEPPQVDEQAELLIGYFNETLPGFLHERLPTEGRAAPQPLRLLHLDCDLYSSAREVLEALRPLITPGCLLVLDDAVNFHGFRDQVFRAFEDFLAAGTSPTRLEVIGAPWTVRAEAELPTNYDGWPVESRYDLERAIAFRVLA